MSFLQSFQIFQRVPTVQEMISLILKSAPGDWNLLELSAVQLDTILPVLAPPFLSMTQKRKSEW